MTRRKNSRMTMEWVGEWRNQYGSILRIDGVDGGLIRGSFTTALEDSGFFGQTIEVYGACNGSCIGVSGADRSSRF